MSRKSPFWRYFTIAADDGRYVVCSLCGVKLSRGGEGKSASTSCMKNHLKNKHLAKFQETFADTSSAPNTAKVSNISQDLIAQEKHTKQKKTASDLDYLICEMITLDKQPVQMVEKVGFNRFLRKALPRYKIPTSSYLTQTVLPEIYDRIHAKVLDRISKAPKLSITSDIWTCDGNRYLRLTAHWLSEGCIFEHAVLSTQRYTGYSTEENIANELNLIMEKWNIPIQKIHILVHDSETNIKSEINPEYNTATCFFQSLHQIINESLKFQSKFIGILNTAREIVEHFNHSELAQATLKILQKSLNLPEKLLVQDVDIRWNSTYYMLERILEQKKVIMLYSANNQFENLTSYQWSLIEQYITLLKPFEVLTKITSSGFSCISEIIPNISALLKYLEKEETSKSAPEFVIFIESLKTEILNSFNLDNEIFLIATFLDPRFKTAFLNPLQSERVQQRIIQKGNMSSDDFISAVKSPPIKIKREETFWDCFDEAATNQMEASEITIENEIDFYSKSFRIDRRSDPYLWWSTNGKEYPGLAKLARIYLSSPCSCVYADSLYSEPGLLYEEKRSHLVPSDDERLNFIHNNLPLVDFEY